MEAIVLTVDALDKEIKDGKKLILLEPLYDSKLNVLIGTEKVLTERDIERIKERCPDHRHKRLKLRTTISHFIEEDKRIKWTSFIISIFEKSELFNPIKKDIKEFVIKYLKKYLTESDYIIWKLSQLKNISKKAFDHSVNSCLISLLIYHSYSTYKQSGMIDAKLIDNIIEASLLHNSGLIHLYQNDPLLLEKKRYEIAPAEDSPFYQYTIEGYRMLKEEFSRHEIADEVLDAVLNCEEFINGSGSPRGIKDADLSFLARIISISNYFELLLSAELSVKPRPYKDYIAKIRSEKDKFDAGLVDSLIISFKYFYQM